MENQAMMFNPRIQVLAVIAGVIMLGVIFELVRKRKIQTNYSVIWFFVCGLFIVFAVWRNLLEKISGLAGIYYAPSALFMILIGIIFLLLLSFSTAISKLSSSNISLAQEVALLKKKLEDKK